MAKRKNLIKLAILLLIVGCFSVFSPNALAATRFIWNGTPNVALQLYTSTNMGTFCVGGTIATGSQGKIVELNWPTGFDVSQLVISDTEADSEVTVYLGSNNCTTGGRVTEPAPGTPGNDRDAAEVIDQQLRITLDLTGDYGPDAFSIGFAPAGSATDTIITPATAGNYPFNARLLKTLGGQPTTSIIDMLYVGNLNQVNISASVDPSLTFGLSSTTCDLGTLSSTVIKTCSYDTTVSTNARNGYSAFIKDDGAFRSGSNNMADVTGLTITAGTEGYGVSSTQGMTGSYYNLHDTCANFNDQGATPATDFVPISTTDDTFGGSSGPVSADPDTVCHAVAISPTTPAGSYAQLVTLTVVGNF